MSYREIVEGKLREVGRSPTEGFVYYEYMKRCLGWVNASLSEPVVSFIKAFFECPTRFTITVERYKDVSYIHTITDKQNGLTFTMCSEHDTQSWCSTRLSKRESTRWVTVGELTVVYWLISDYYDERTEKKRAIVAKRYIRGVEAKNKAMREHLKSFYC